MRYIIESNRDPETAMESRIVVDKQRNIEPIGSGVLLMHRDYEHLVTARHVAEACSYNPLIKKEVWESFPEELEVIGENEDADVIVFKKRKRYDRTFDKVSPLDYGGDWGIVGSVGLAVGFPHFEGDDPYSGQFVLDTNAPRPLHTLVSYDVPRNGRVGYMGSSILPGFSGGALVVHGPKQPVLVGIITQTMIIELMKKVTIRSGFARYASIRSVEEILAKHVRSDIGSEEYKAYKPYTTPEIRDVVEGKAKVDFGWNAKPSLATDNVLGNVVMLGRTKGVPQ